MNSHKIVDEILTLVSAFLLGFVVRGVLDRESAWFRKFWYGTGKRKDRAE